MNEIFKPTSVLNFGAIILYKKLEGETVAKKKTKKKAKKKGKC